MLCVFVLEHICSSCFGESSDRLLGANVLEHIRTFARAHSQIWGLRGHPSVACGRQLARVLLHAARTACSGGGGRQSGKLARGGGRVTKDRRILFFLTYLSGRRARLRRSDN